MAATHAFQSIVDAMSPYMRCGASSGAIASVVAHATVNTTTHLSTPVIRVEWEKYEICRRLILLHHPARGRFM